MRLFGLLLLALGMSACDATPASERAQHRGGRYQGIGIYGAGRMWQHIVTPAPDGDGRAARTADDEVVIAVVDSHTGEIRQCGNISGRCIAMNPWAVRLGPDQALPVSVDAHLPGLERAEREQSAADLQNNAAAADPAPASHR